MSRAGALMAALVAASTLAASACTAGGDAAGSGEPAPPAASTDAIPSPATAAPEDTAAPGAVTAPHPTAVVGLSVLAPVPALELTASGFKDSVAACDTVAIEVLERNARGDIPELTSIAEGFLQADVDLIATVSTPAAQGVSIPQHLLELAEIID
ncbi:MAG: hypothetical protein R2761_03155 [Acidimicrobiales bacterium]